MILVSFIILNVFTIFAIIHSFKKAVFLILINISLWSYFIWTLTPIKYLLRYRVYDPLRSLINKLPYKNYIKLFLLGCILIPVFVYVIVEAFKTKEQLVSLGGLFILIFISGVFSKYPARVSFGTVD